MQLTLFDELYNTKNIEDQMIEKMLFKGSGFVNGKIRINKFTLTNPPINIFVDFLKKEYGIGGYGGGLRGPYQIHRDWHDAKGIRFEYHDEEGNEIKQSIDWIKAANMIGEMIKSGTYL